MRSAAMEAEASVLGLRSEDAAAGEALTGSLRSAFANRGMSGGEDLSLEEVVLTLGCSSETDTTCMTEAGRALSVKRLVYGNLKDSGDGGFILDISVLDVTAGQIEAQATMPLAASDLSADNVDMTAAEVVNSLYPGDDDETVGAPPPDQADEGTDETGQDPIDEPRSSNLVWGAYEPRPKWKKVGLGLSIGVLAAGVLTIAVAGSLTKFKYEKTVQDESKASRDPDDGNPFNDVVYREGVDPVENRTSKDDCVLAKQPTRLPPGDNVPEGAVVNEAVANACSNGQVTTTITNAAIGVAVVGGLSTILFAILYNVHKKPAEGSEARHRRFRLTGGPTRGGVLLGGTGRF